MASSLHNEYERDVLAVVPTGLSQAALTLNDRGPDAVRVFAERKCLCALQDWSKRQSVLPLGVCLRCHHLCLPDCARLTSN